MAEENQPSLLEHCISDISECPICNEVLNDNRCLPCLHTFCRKCLESYIKGKATAKTLSCPVCRREFPMPKFVSNLPRNFFIDKLLDAYKIKKQERLPDMCDICSEDNSTAAKWRSTISHAGDYTKFARATRFCCDCHQNMCLSCERQHKKIKGTSMHKIIDNPNTTDPQEPSPRPAFCTTHTTKLAEVYCQECRFVICWQCKALSHSNHSSVELGSAAKNLVKTLEVHVTQIAKHLRSKEAAVRNLKEHEKLYMDETDAEVANICRELNKLYRNITENGEKLRQALTYSSACYLKPIRTLQNNFEKDINDLQKHKVYIEQMIHLGNASDLCEYTDKLISETARMTAENTSAIRLTIPPAIHVHLSDSDLHDLLTGRRTDINHQYGPFDGHLDIGLDNRKTEDLKTDLSPSDQLKRSFKDNSTSAYTDWSLEETIESGDGESVFSGITVLDSKLYIASQSSNEIRVYSLSEKSFLPSLTVDRLVNPNDITSCKFNNCLYICDWAKSRMFRVQISERMTQIKWGMDGDMGGLSVTTDHNILLSGYKSNKLKEYTSDGKLLRSISLGGDLKPWHAIKLMSNEYLICHGDNVKNGYHRVCITDSKGKLVNSFGGDKGSDESHMFGPYYMAVDKSGYVLVTDCNNSRILLLSPSLQFIKEIIPSASNVLRRARRLYLDEDTGRLFVANNVMKDKVTKDGKILIFAFS